MGAQGRSHPPVRRRCRSAKRQRVRASSGTIDERTCDVAPRRQPDRDRGREDRPLRRVRVPERSGHDRAAADRQPGRRALLVKHPPDAVYEFAVATDGGTQPDLAFRIRFDPRGPCDRSRASPRPPGSGRRPAAPPRQRIGDRRRRARGERRRSVPARRAGLPGPRAGVLVAGRGNGRALGDDVFAAANAAVTGQRLGARTPPAKASGESPHVTAPQRAALPALADLFGLRVARPTSR